MIIYVTVINHRYGDNCYAHKSRESAVKNLAGYCRDNWNNSHIGLKETPIPNDDRMCIDRYFDAAYYDEHYTTHDVIMED